MMKMEIRYCHSVNATPYVGMGRSMTTYVMIQFGFYNIGLDISFLEENVEKWDQLDSYLAAKAAVKNRKVVNDSSERGVKITYDFLEQARKEDRF